MSVHVCWWLTLCVTLLLVSAGAPFQWAAIFHKEDINFTHGHHDLTWYDSQEKTTRHKLPCKVSCSYCRTPIMDEGRNMILLFPTLIHFKSHEDKKNFKPRWVSRLADIARISMQCSTSPLAQSHRIVCS